MFIHFFVFRFYFNLLSPSSIKIVAIYSHNYTISHKGKENISIIHLHASPFITSKLNGLDPLEIEKDNELN